MNQNQPNRPHGDGYVPQQQQHPRSNRPHGDGFVPQQQQHPRSGNHHGDGFVPQQQQHPRPDSLHDGGLIPEPQHGYSNRTYAGRNAPSQHPQSQGQGVGQVGDLFPSETEQISE